MLRFLFRNKKEQPESGQKRTFWIYALGEFLLVFLGILIALQVDNWNQGRQEKKLERILLKEMLLNLENDLEDVVYNMAFYRNIIHSNEVVLNYLNSDIEWHDSLKYHFGHIAGGTLFDKNTSAYESLTSIGIDLVKNDSLRQQITHIYSTSYHRILTTEQMVLKHALETLNQDISELIFTADLRSMAVPLDIAVIKASNRFRHNLMTNIRLMRIQKDDYDRAKTQILKLTGDIETELD